jgi:hypothetical protein
MCILDLIEHCTLITIVYILGYLLLASAQVGYGTHDLTSWAWFGLFFEPGLKSFPPFSQSVLKPAIYSFQYQM